MQVAEILKLSVALSYWTYEYLKSDIGDTRQLEALDEIMRKLNSAVRKLKKEQGN